MKKIDASPRPSGHGQTGMSLIEVMIAAAIMTILLLGFASMTSNNTKSVQALSQKLAAVSLETLMRSAFLDSMLCTTTVLTSVPALATFNGSSAASAAAATVIIPNGVKLSTAPGAPPLATPGLALDYGLKIQDVRFKNFVSTAGYPLPTPSAVFKADLVVTFQPSSMIITGMTPRTIPQLLNVDTTAPASSVIKSCTSSQTPFSGNYANVKAARSFGTVYTNTSPLPRFVTVNAQSTLFWNQKYIVATVNGVVVQQITVTDANDGMGWLAASNHVNFIVPPGQTYSVSVTDPSVSLDTWMELN